MANPEDAGPDFCNAKKPTPTELKKELEKLIKLILNEDDYEVQELNKAICILSSLKEKNARGNETTDEAIRVVSSLRELKIKESAVPKESMSGEIMGDPVVVASGQLSQAQNVGIVIREGHSNDIRVAEEKEKLGGKCKGKEKVTSSSRGRENAIQEEEDVSVVQSIPLPCYDVVDHTKNGVYMVSSGYESAPSIGQQGSGRRMERGEPSRRNEDRRVRKKTYNCPSIEECFRQGHKTRPKTKQELTNSLLTPNNLLKIIIDSLLDNMMSSSLSDQKSSAKTLRQLTKQYPPFRDLLGNKAVSKLLEPHDVPGNTCPDLDPQLDIITMVFNILISNLLKNIIDSLLDNMMSSSLSDQKSSAKTLRQLTKQYPLFRDFFGNDEAVSKLLKPLDVLGNACLDLDLQLDIITTLFNISLPKGNKKVVAENLRVIPLLKIALRTGTSNTQSTAAAALLNISELNLNRTLIHESGALGPLIHLIGGGNSETMTDVCKAMYMLCWDGANTVAHREKAVSDGAVRVILRKVKKGVFLDLLLPVLATFSSLPSAAEEMRKKGAVACLLKVMESGDKDSNAIKSCVAILRNIWSYDKDELKEVKQEEAANGTISSVALRGTQKGRKKRHWIV